MRFLAALNFFITILTLGSIESGKNIKIFFEPVFLIKDNKVLSKLLSF